MIDYTSTPGICRRPGARRAFTMVELIIGMVILAFMIFYTFSMFTGEIGSISRTRDYSAAVLIAQQTVEMIRSYPFDKLSRTDAPGQSLEDFLNDSTPNADFPHKVTIGKIDFIRNVRIDSVNGPGNTPLQLKAVSIEIKWTNEEKRDLVYKIATCVTKLQ